MIVARDYDSDAEFNSRHSVAVAAGGAVFLDLHATRADDLSQTLHTHLTRQSQQSKPSTYMLVDGIHNRFHPENSGNTARIPPVRHDFFYDSFINNPFDSMGGC